MNSHQLLTAKERAEYYEEKLRNLIRTSSKSQKEIAEDAGITEVTLCNFKNERSKLLFPNFISVIPAAGGNLENFFFISEEEAQKIINKRPKVLENGIATPKPILQK